MKFRKAIALSIFTVLQFSDSPVKAKSHVYMPCHHIELLLQKELEKNNINPIEVKYQYPGDTYLNYPKNISQMALAIVKYQDEKILSNINFQKQLFTKLSRNCPNLGAITLGLQQSGYLITVGRSLTSTEPKEFRCIDNEKVGNKLEWGTQYCDSKK